MIVAVANGVCPAPSQYIPTGDYNITLNFANTERRALLHVPPGYDGKTPLALVFNFHGDLGWPEQEADLTGFSIKADKEKFFVIYPAGTGNSFNAGTCCIPASLNLVDDAGFINALLDKLLNEVVCGDPAKVFSTGFSNGGFMSYRLACGDHGDRFAAIAPVSGVFGYNGLYPCSPTKPVSILHIHGTMDPIVNYTGTFFGSLQIWLSVAETARTWSEKNGCTFSSNVTTFTNRTVHCDSISCPDPSNNNITVCTVVGGGHAYPGGKGFFGGPADITATDAIWEFFSRFEVPPVSSAVSIWHSNGCLLLIVVLFHLFA
jgi:polyhydroxybutyrate depolymerase